MSEQRQRTERHVQINPYYRGQAWEPFNDWPRSTVFDQDFGMVSDPDFELSRQRFVRDPWSSRVAPVPSPVVVPRVGPALTRQLSGGLSQVTTEGDKFKVSLDVKHFTPEQITVKTVGNFIEIHGKHEEKKDDHGVISRDFTRKYTIPPNVDPISVTSSLSPDGFLTVEAPIQKQAIEGPVKLQVQHEKSASSSESSSLEAKK